MNSEETKEILNITKNHLKEDDPRAPLVQAVMAGMQSRRAPAPFLVSEPRLETETIMDIEDFHYKLFLEQVRNITHRRFKFGKKRTRILNHLTYEIHNLSRSLTKKEIPRDETIEESSYQAAKDLSFLDNYLGSEQSISDLVEELQK